MNCKVILKFSLFLFLLALIYSCKPELKQIESEKVEGISIEDGFLIEHLLSPSENEYGSWVSMTFDDKGRLIASDQFGALYRMNIPEINGEDSLKVEKLNIGSENLDSSDTSKQVSFGFAQGLLWAYNSLYVVVNHSPNDKFSKGSGLYRLEDTNGDDQFDKVTKLIDLDGSGEHGPHSIILSPDKESLYLVLGNHTEIPELDNYLLPRSWDEDNIFPAIVDPQGHATEVRAPGGWIVKTDSVGSKWELIAAGLRNTFDITFNKEGDLFAYDSDMEWDFGMPWYRPTRILHVTSGSEFGWRTGNSKWSPSYLDNLPAILNVGQGSPTNFMSAYDASFPEEFKNSLFAFDWSFGIIYSVGLEVEGASYKAKAKEFLSGAPLPLTDGVIGPDGAMYFLTGGRELESDLYRVYHKNHFSLLNKSSEDSDYKLSEDHILRRNIERFHSDTSQFAVDSIVPYLNHNDRYIRYASRIALEHQPIDNWRDLVRENLAPSIKVPVILAAARTNSSSFSSEELIEELAKIDVKNLDSALELDLLRTLEVIFYRNGKPNQELSLKLINLFKDNFPSKDSELNKQYSKILTFLEYEGAIEVILSLMEKEDDDSEYQELVMSSEDLIQRNPQYGLDIAGMLEKTPPASQIFYSNVLSVVKSGWTDESREKYFKWYYDAFGFKGGNSYIGFINKSRTTALDNLPGNLHAYYNNLSGDSLLSARGTSLQTVEGLPKGPGKNWELEDALSTVRNDSLGKPNFKQGGLLFQAVRCGSCHTVQGEGGSYGPDLTQLGNRFSKKDILEKIIDPNKNISDQYGSQIFKLDDGTSILGKLLGEEDEYYLISQNPYDPLNSKKIQKSKVVSRTKSQVSVMPKGTINVLNAEELRDLLAYLVSGGNENNEVYKN